MTTFVGVTVTTAGTVKTALLEEMYPSVHIKKILEFVCPLFTICSCRQTRPFHGPGVDFTSFEMLLEGCTLSTKHVLLALDNVLEYLIAFDTL